MPKANSVWGVSRIDKPAGLDRTIRRLPRVNFSEAASLAAGLALVMRGRRSPRRVAIAVGAGLVATAVAVAPFLPALLGADAERVEHVVVADAGHLVPLEKPAEVTAALAALIRRTTAEGSAVPA